MSLTPPFPLRLTLQPTIILTSIKKINALVKSYFDLDADEIFLSPSDKSKEDILFSIDAEILRLYDLPPKLERQLLDFFAGHQRKDLTPGFRCTSICLRSTKDQRLNL